MINTNMHYFVCGVRHSGTHILCEALKNSQIAGVPDEHLLMWQDEWVTQPKQLLTRAHFLQSVIEAGCTPNGVFGCKLLWHYFGETMSALRKWPQYQETEDFAVMQHLFSQPRYIWVVHRDKVQQAISWALASQTGTHSAPSNRFREPEFDFTLIDNLRRLIEVGEQGWQNYFERGGITPLTIVYEDLMHNFDQTMLDVFAFLDLDQSNTAPLPHISRQKIGERRTLQDRWRIHYWEIRELRSDRWTFPMNGPGD